MYVCIASLPQNPTSPPMYAEPRHYTPYHVGITYSIHARAHAHAHAHTTHKISNCMYTVGYVNMVRYPWCLSMVPIHGAYPWCLSMVPIHGAYPWCLSMVPIHGAYPWCLSMVPIHGAYPWCLSMVPIHGAYPWCLSMVFKVSGL